MRLKRWLPSLILLSLIAWIVGSLVASGRVVIWMLPLNLEQLTLLRASFANLISYMILAFMATSLVVLVIRRRMLIEILKQKVSARVRSSNYNSLFSLIVGFAILILLIYMFRAGLIPELRGVQNFGSSLPPNDTSLGKLHINATSLLSPQTSTFVFHYAFASILLATIVVVTIITMQALKEIRDEAEEKQRDNAKEEAAKSSVLKAVQEAFISSQYEEDFRAVIIRCYRRMCEILADRGVPIHDHQTVREFEAVVSNVLKIPRQPLAKITDIFEEARYSLHEMDQAKRNEALKCLTDIRDYLMAEGAAIDEKLK